MLDAFKIYRTYRCGVWRVALGVWGSEVGIEEEGGGCLLLAVCPSLSLYNNRYESRKGISIP